jgi:hypothetical protein
MHHKKKPHEKHDSSLEDEIAECAYFIWESEGHPIGREAEHWHQAELQVCLSHVQDSALDGVSPVLERGA